MRLLALPQDWWYGVLELGRQICRAEMPAKRRLRALEKLDKAFDQSNPTMIKDLRWLLTLIINEGMEEGETPLTEQQVGKLIHIGNLPQIKDAIFSAFVYSTNGGEEKEAADGEADTTEEGNRVAVQDE